MGFWPFGKGKDKEEEAEVDFASRVVASSPQDGTTVRGKMTIHFVDATTQELADEAANASATIARELIKAALTHEDLLGQEAELAAGILSRMTEQEPEIRSIDVVALHVVGDLMPSSTATPMPASRMPSSVAPSSAAPSSVAPSSVHPSSVASSSVAPRSAPPPRAHSSRPPPDHSLDARRERYSDRPPPDRFSADRISPDRSALDKPSSVPPRTISESSPPSRHSSRPPTHIEDLPPASRKPDSMPPPRSQLPSSSGVPSSRRHSSGQLLAVRGARLVPQGATPEATGKALIPLMRDAATKLLIAVLRAYDLLVVRRISVDDSAEALDAIVPVSTAPLGFFADSRADELDRWETALGLLKLEAIRSETAAVTCFFLHLGLDHAGMAQSTSTTILETIGSAFDHGSLSQIGRYLHLVDGSPAGELANAIVKIVGHREDLVRLEVALTPVLASLQEDLSFAAAQARG